MSDSTKPSETTPQAARRVLKMGLAIWLAVLAMVPISHSRGQDNRWFEILLPLTMVGWLWAMIIDPNQGGFVISKRVAWLLAIAGALILFGRIRNLVV